MTKLKLMMPWLITNAILFGSLYIGHFLGNAGFMSVFWFMVWALIALMFCLWFSKKSLERVCNSPAGIPLWLILCLDFSILFFIVWNHNIVTGAFWLVHMIIITEVHKKIREQKDGK